MQFPTTALLLTLLTATASLTSAQLTTITVVTKKPQPAPTTTADANGLVANPTDPIVMCGSAPYHKSQYTCFNNKSLCPIKGGIVYQLCVGDGGCFNPAKYQCVNGHLGPK